MIKQKFKIATLILLTTLASTPVTASTWYFAWAGNEDTRYFFDADSVEKSKDVVVVWVKTVQVSKVDSDGSWSNALRWRFNCVRKTIQNLAISRYGQDGKFISSAAGSSTETLVVPDSTGDAMLKIACKANFPNDKSEVDYFKLENIDVFEATKNYLKHIKSRTDSAPQ